jgi:hypothetical protein
MRPIMFTSEQKAQARKEIKALGTGHKLKMTSHTSHFTGTRFEFVHFTTPQGMEVSVDPDSTVYGTELIEENKPVFEIINRIFFPAKPKE